MPIEHHLLGVHAARKASVFHPSSGSGEVSHDFQLVPRGVIYLELSAGRSRSSHDSAAARTGTAAGSKTRKVKMREVSA